MKDVAAIFSEYLLAMRPLLDGHNFQGCSYIASDLIRVASMAEFKDGIFIGEILESIFDQMEPLFRGYEVSDEDRTNLEKRMKEQIESLAKSSMSSRKEEIYAPLMNLRVIATEFQLQCWRMRKERAEDNGEPRFIRRRIK